MAQSVSVYGFLFHPFADEMPPETGRWAKITFGVLTVFTAGVYALFVLVVRVGEAVVNFFTGSDEAPPAKKVVVSRIKRRMELPHLSPQFLNRNHFPRDRFVGVETFKAILMDQVAIFEAYAKAGRWVDLAIHTADQYSGFDWWVFPYGNGSSGQGEAYAVDPVDRDALYCDEEFMRSYRRAVCLVALSWGWDLEKGEKVVGNAEQRWRGYAVRLHKMRTSLIYFGQSDLLDALDRLSRDRK